MVSDRKAFRFKKGARVFFECAGTTVWIVEQIGIAGTSYMIATFSGSVKRLDWANEENLIPVFNPLIE